ncbi:MAG: hypothetical protein LUH08_03905, partial [Ruminococcus sp.]|nr:hypothetical protein [Ruminococcus sp.]
MENIKGGVAISVVASDKITFSHVVQIVNIKWKHYLCKILKLKSIWESVNCFGLKVGEVLE